MVLSDPIGDLVDVLIVSPHFDDAVLSAGGRIAALERSGLSTCVLTVFGGVPESRTPPSRWDVASGFASAAQAALMRRSEDQAALEFLGSTGLAFDAYDGPYRADWEQDAYSSFLLDAASTARTIYIPAAIGKHPDHVLARDATLHALSTTNSMLNIRVYADLPYATVEGSMAGFSNSSFSATEASTGRRMTLGDVDEVHLADELWTVKRSAVVSYRSQIPELVRAFGDFVMVDSLLRSERFWSLKLAS